MKTLVAIPVYNEESSVRPVLAQVLEYADDVLVIDDGSTDDTPCLLAKFPVNVVRHAHNQGYGRSLKDAFLWAQIYDYDWVITMDCDEQHEPRAIPRFEEAAAADQWDVLSGSRYLALEDASGSPPPDRRRINADITREINERLGLNLTDAFCGFKAYRVSALRHLELTENGYAMPLQFWVQAVAAGLRITEISVRLIYTDASRSFGGPLDNPEIRLGHYRQVLHCELERQAARLPSTALTGVDAGCRCQESHR